MTLPRNVWGHYAHRTYQQAQRAGHQIHNRQAFEEAVALDGIRRLSPLAARWWSTFLVEPVQLAEWLIDGKPSVYARRRL